MFCMDEEKEAKQAKQEKEVKKWERKSEEIGEGKEKEKESEKEKERKKILEKFLKNRKCRVSEWSALQTGKRVNSSLILADVIIMNLER